MLNIAAMKKYYQNLPKSQIRIDILEDIFALIAEVERLQNKQKSTVMYGIYNTMKKEFQFGICEPSKNKASKKLFEKIGKGAYKWRFEVRKLPEVDHERL